MPTWRISSSAWSTKRKRRSTTCAIFPLRARYGRSWSRGNKLKSADGPLRTRIRVGLTPAPTAHAKSEQHESGHEPAAGGFQFWVGKHVFMRQNVEPSERRFRDE